MLDFTSQMSDVRIHQLIARARFFQWILIYFGVFSIVISAQIMSLSKPLTPEVVFKRIAISVQQYAAKNADVLISVPLVALVGSQSRGKTSMLCYFARRFVGANIRTDTGTKSPILYTFRCIGEGIE